MSYLLQHALRRSASIGRRARNARIDETTILNRPDFDGGALVRCFVEDTSRRRRRHARIRLEIADCVRSIHLEFRLDSPAERENALYKANTLIAALHRFRDALNEEAELAAGHDQRKEA